jgi:hypothetical protein
MYYIQERFNPTLVKGPFEDWGWGEEGFFLCVCLLLTIKTRMSKTVSKVYKKLKSNGTVR